MAEQGEASRIVTALGQWAGLSEQEITEIASVAPDLGSLQRLDASALHAVPREVSQRMREVARLADLPGMTIPIARQLVEQGFRLENLGEEDGEATSLARTYNLRPETLIAAARKLELPPPAREIISSAEIPPSPLPSRPLVTAHDTSWTDLATRLYQVEGEAAETLGRTLAAANRSSEEHVQAGTRLILPEVPGVNQRPAGEANDLTRFASYIDSVQSTALAKAGFTEPNALLHLNPPDDARIIDLPEITLQRLKLQAAAVCAGIAEEVAHALAASGDWNTQFSLAVAQPEHVLRSLRRAEALGLLPSGTTDTITPETMLRWIARYGHVVGSPLAPLGTLQAAPVLDSPCTASLPGDASLENFYAYRVIPAGRTSTDLTSELGLRRQYLDEVDVLLRSGGVKSRDEADMYRERVLATLGLSWSEEYQHWIYDWGLNPYNADGNDLINDDEATAVHKKLSNLGVFLQDSADLLELLKDLVEGHESYQRGELGLALAAYGRVEQWFQHKLSSGLKRSIDPSLDSRGFPAQLKTWYEGQRPGLDNSTFLDYMQLTFSSYQRNKLEPWDATNMRPSPDAEPFRKHLYYLRSFVLPLCRHDCYLDMGNYCDALSELLSIRYQATYTHTRSDAEEDTIGLGVARNPAIPEAGTDPTGANWGKFPEAYLHPIERRLLDFKCTQLMREWGEYHERRANPLDANHPDTLAARARYAQVLRIQYPWWSSMKGRPFTTMADFRNNLRAIPPGQSSPTTPLMFEHALAAQQGLLRLQNGLNFIGYDPSYVPVWTYQFLLNSARYLADHARQLERDALQFLDNAERELGNQRLLVQLVGSASSQLGVEDRRVAEANATVSVTQASYILAMIRRWNNYEQIREWDTYAPTLLALGVVGGAIGGAGSGASLGKGNAYAMAIGAAEGATSAYISGSIEESMRRSEMVRQGDELSQAIGLATAEGTRAGIAAEVASLMRAQAAALLVAAQSNLEFATAKALSADTWFTLAKRAREFARRYLDTAIRTAFLAEQALEFLSGRRIDRIKFDYPSTQDRLAAESLLLDIDSLEADRVLSREQKEHPVRHVVPLRIRDFWSFERLKQTGSITFDTTVSEFDLAYPGTFMHRLVDIEVEVRALTPPTGIRGTLTKSGLSWLRIRDANGFAANATNVVPDWITQTPSAYKIAPVVQEQESMVLSSYDVRRDAVLLRSQEQGELLRLFEGSGPGCTWQLTIDPWANDFDMRTITDVNLVLYMNAYYDPQLARVVDLERQKLIALGGYVTEKSKGYAFRDRVPDSYYYLINPGTTPDDQLERVIFFEALDRDFPQSEVNRRVEAATLAFLGRNGPVPVTFAISSAVHSPNYRPAEDRRDTLQFESSTAATTDSTAPNVYAFTNFQQDPVDRWFLRVRADDNPSLAVTDEHGNAVRFKLTAGHLQLDAAGRPIPDAAGRSIFDDAKLAALVDVWWIFRYRYELPGRRGDPIVLWSHFGSDAQAHFARPDHTVGLAPWKSIVLRGSGEWYYQANRLRYRYAGVGIAIPDGAFSWGNIELFAVVEVPKEDGCEIGVVARYHEALPHSPQRFYRLRLINVRATEADRVDVRLEKVNGPHITVLARRDHSRLGRGTDHELSLLARGTAIQVSVDGVPLLSAQDKEIDSGSVGLYAMGVGESCSELWVSDLTGRP